MIKKELGSMTSFVLGLIATFACMPLCNAVAQQSPKPAAVIGIASMDEQLKDVEYIAGATSEMAGQMSGMARMQAEGFMPGVDFTKPAGTILYFVEGKMEPNAIAFFPVTNLDDTLDRISEYAEIEEDGDTVTILPDNGEELVLKSQNGYAFVSDQAELLENLPKDPGGMIAEQTKKYNVSAVIYPQQVPEELRQQALDFIRQGFEASMGDMDDLQASLQEAQFDMQMKQMEMMVNEFERITIGMDADKATERLFVDINMKGVDDSDMSKRLIASKTSKPSKFTGFLMDNAAITMHNCSGISDDDAKLYVESFENVRDVMLDEIVEESDENKAEVLTKITNQLSSVIKKTLQGGVLDMGGAIFTTDGINAAFGAQIADARSLESSIKDIVNEAKSELTDEGLVFNLNSGKHNGFNLHNVTIDLPMDELDDAIGDLFGEQLKVVLGISDSQVYLAAGKDPETTLKKSIDANIKTSPKSMDLIGQYNFFVAPIMKMVADLQDEEMMEAMSDEIQETGKDRIRVTYNVVDGEMQFRMEMQDGILKMLGVISQYMGPMAGGGADF